MTDRLVYVYRLVISYPGGSDKPGWKPACWGQMLKEIKDRGKRRAVRERGFYWPRERLFLSADGAWHRAWVLTRFGAAVEVERSEAVTWPDYGESANGRDWESGSTAARWEPPEVDPLDAAALYLYPAPDSYRSLGLELSPESTEQGAEPADAVRVLVTRREVRDFTDFREGIYVEDEWHR